MKSALSLIALMAPLAMALNAGDPCPPGGGNFCIGKFPLSERVLTLGPFTNIILRCSTGTSGGNGTLIAGNCNDNLAGVPPVGVKTDAICGNSTANNADCFLPPYPSFITPPSTSTSASSTAPPPPPTSAPPVPPKSSGKPPKSTKPCPPKSVPVSGKPPSTKTVPVPASSGKPPPKTTAVVTSGLPVFKSGGERIAAAWGVFAFVGVLLGMVV